MLAALLVLPRARQTRSQHRPAGAGSEHHGAGRGDGRVVRPDRADRPRGRPEHGADGVLARLPGRRHDPDRRRRVAAAAGRGRTACAERCGWSPPPCACSSSATCSTRTSRCTAYSRRRRARRHLRVALVLFVLAARCQGPMETARTAHRRTGAAQRVSWMPYLAVAAGFVGARRLRGHRGRPGSLIVALAAAALAALVSARQLLRAARTGRAAARAATPRRRPTR